MSEDRTRSPITAGDDAASASVFGIVEAWRRWALDLVGSAREAESVGELAPVDREACRALVEDLAAAFTRMLSASDVAAAGGLAFATDCIAGARGFELARQHRRFCRECTEAVTADFATGLRTGFTEALALRPPQPKETLQ